MRSILKASALALATSVALVSGAPAAEQLSGELKIFLDTSNEVKITGELEGGDGPELSLSDLTAGGDE